VFDLKYRKGGDVMDYKKMGIKKALEMGNDDLIVELYQKDSERFMTICQTLGRYYQDRISEILKDGVDDYSKEHKTA
jgi:hypothetical protein